MVSQAQILLDEVTKWAKTKAEISGVVLVGSYARNEAKDGSDVDFVLLVSEPKDFIAETGWIKDFGPVKSYTVEEWGLVTSVRVYYASGLEVEYGVTSLEWASEPLDEGSRRVIATGMRILLDRVGLLRRAQEETNRG